jgi:hypothetical protein
MPTCMKERRVPRYRKSQRHPKIGEKRICRFLVSVISLRSTVLRIEIRPRLIQINTVVEHARSRWISST